MDNNHRLLRIDHSSINNRIVLNDYTERVYNDLVAEQLAKDLAYKRKLNITTAIIGVLVAVTGVACIMHDVVVWP